MGVTKRRIGTLVCISFLNKIKITIIINSPVQVVKLKKKDLIIGALVYVSLTVNKIKEKIIIKLNLPECRSTKLQT